MKKTVAKKKDKRRQINCRVRPDIYEQVEERARMRGYSSPVSYVMDLIYTDPDSPNGLVNIGRNNDLSRLEFMVSDMARDVKTLVKDLHR